MTEKKKAKLLIATDAFLPRWDGISRYLHEILPGLVSHFDITVIAPSFPGFEDHKEKNEGYRVIRVSTFRFKLGDYSPPKYHFGIIKKEVMKTDIVWTHAIMPIGKLAIWYGRKYRKTVIDTIHSYEWELAMNSLSNWNPLKYPSFLVAKVVANFFYNKCDLLLVPDQETAEVLQFHFINAPTKVVRLGVDLKRFTPPKDKGAAKKALGIDPKSIVIGYAGRLGREKNLETLFRAFKKLRQEHSNIFLLIGGKGVKKYEDMFANHAHTKFLGESNEIQKYYQAMDIYVLPSLTETTSLSTMEAMACGVPAVTTKVGYVKKYVKDRVNGLFFPKRNSAVLTLKLKKLIQDPIMREAMSQLARKTIADEFSWTNTQNDIRDTFNTF